MRLFFIPLFCLLFTACLPGESDVAERYNNINQRAAVENAGLSLAQAAQNLTTYRVAKVTVRKSPLDDAMLTTLPTINEQENPKPASPAGVKVVNCGKFGSLAYFTAQPKGLPPLKSISSTMIRALAARFGGQNVGLSLNGQIEKPVLTKNMSNCTVDNDILPGSPIFASGFEYKDDRLPDKKKVTWPSVTRNVTIPCPSGYQGVIKRDQKCTLISNEQDTERETGQIKVGGYDTLNPRVRLDKQWRCETTNNPPTATEIATFCRDPSKNMAKPNDNAIELKADSLQQILTATGPGYYTFKCRTTPDNPTACDVTPFTSTLPNTFLRCDKINTQPLYVTNPISPLTLDASGNVIGNPAATQDCGRGWTGKLTARYLVRRCNLYKTVDGGAPQLLKQTQTIYHIAYAAAQCSTRVSTRVQCPVGNLSGTVPIVRDLIMLKPAALDYRPRIPGVVDWSTSQMSTNDSRDEIKTEAVAKGFVIPDISRADLASASDTTEWSLKVANAMKRADEDSISMPLFSCDPAGQTCVPPTSGQPLSGVLFVIDKSPLALSGGYSGPTTLNYRNKLCVGGTGTCSAFLGDTQTTCTGGGICGLGSQQSVSGANVAEAVSKYIEDFVRPNLPGITVQEFTGPDLFFYTPRAVEDLSGQRFADVIIIAPSDDSPPTPPLQGQYGTYSDWPALLGFVQSENSARFSTFTLSGTPIGGGLGAGFNYDAVSLNTNLSNALATAASSPPPSSGPTPGEICAQIR